MSPSRQFSRSRCRSRFLFMGLAFTMAWVIVASEEGEPAKRKVAPRSISGLQSWDAKLIDLEHKLETDLERVEQDAKRSAASTTRHHHSSTKRHQHHQDDKKKKKHHHSTQTTKMDNATEAALERVRGDIQNLVNSVKQAEEELGRAKAQVSMDEEAIKQKNAEIKTEKILEELHNQNHINVKVDYVTGKLVANSRIDRRSSAGAAVQRVNKTATIGDGITAESPETLDAETDTGEGQEETHADSLQNEAEGGDDKVLEDIIDAAASILKEPVAALENEDSEVSDNGDTASDNVVHHIEMNPNLKSRVRLEIEAMRSGADPAVMSMDMQLLLDIVKLAITASLFGLAAVFLRLPPTAGFLVGGMLIGPSCWDVIGEIHQVQTLAQFGSVFLLFEQGLLYSQTYSGAAVLGSALATGRFEEDQASSSNSVTPKTDSKSSVQMRRTGSGSKTNTQVMECPPKAVADAEHDPNVVGSILLILLIFSSLAIMVLTDVASSTPEAVFVSCSIAVCSTTIVSENLHAAHIANTRWGKGVLKMIAIQDLFMVPLLALPEIVASLYEEEEDEADDEEDTESASLGRLAFHLFLVVVFLTGTMVFARHVVSAASLAQARMMGEKSELFTLSIVAYALLIATTSEQLKISIEAGAVLAGIALMKSNHVPKILASIQPITSVFGGMYMTSLGMILSPRFVLNEAGSILQLVALIFIFKLALVSTVLNRFFDYGITPSLAVGSAMAQVSEASLLVLAKAQRSSLVSRKTYLLLIPATCLMLTMAPFSAAHLRRLKMQEVSGNDDERIPYYLCFLKRLLRHPHRTIPFHSQGDESRRR